jgi:hypothetical protein
MDSVTLGGGSDAMHGASALPITATVAHPVIVFNDGGSSVNYQGQVDESYVGDIAVKASATLTKPVFLSAPGGAARLRISRPGLV